MTKNAMKANKINTLFLLLISTVLIACGGGSGTTLTEGSNSGSSGSNSSGIGIPLVTPDDFNWELGQFNPSGEFKNLCESPRTEIDQTTQDVVYPDTFGSLLDEKNWLRSWSNENYLWYSELEDSNPSLYGNPIEYFSILKTLETTASGQDKDRFHFTQATQDFTEESQSGLSVGYGFTVVVTSSEVPREVVIAYTQPNSPATSESINLKRGSKILAVDGIDIINTTADNPALGDAYAGLFPATLGETHTFLIKDLDSGVIREIEINSVQVTLQPVQNSKIIETAEGKMGYLLFNEHIEIAEPQLIEAMTQFQNESVTDLVLDIRYNGGGLIYIANGLASMISSAEKTEGVIFNKPTFNDKHPTIDPFTGDVITGTNFYQTSTDDKELPHLNLSRVYVLTGEGTCSASELIMNGLKGIDVDVIQIGSSTCGKPHGFYPTDNCGTTYFSINFKSENNKGFGDYDDGFIPAESSSVSGVLLPGCLIQDDYTKELGDLEEGRLAAAIYYRDNGECPVNSSKPTNNQKSNDIPSKPFWLNNAIIINGKI